MEKTSEIVDKVEDVVTQETQDKRIDPVDLSQRQ